MSGPVDPTAKASGHAGIAPEWRAEPRDEEPSGEVGDRAVLAEPLGADRVPFPLPDGSHDAVVVAFAMGSPDDLLRRLLSAGEEVPAFLERAVTKRKAEYLAGRRAATHALASAGAGPSCSVGRKADRSPVWPGGFVGSITHGGGCVAAVAAPRARYAGLGIDAESLLEGRVSAEVGSSIVEPGELQPLEGSLSDVARPSLLSLAFSAKESLYKCLSPLVGRFFGFHDALLIEVGEDSASGGYFRLKLAISLSSSFPAGWEVAGRFLLANGRVHTAIGVRE